MAQAESKNWFQRNWLWAVPTGCLTLLVLCAAGVALLVAVVFGAMKSSDVYKEALVKAQASSAVAEALGTPVEPGYFVGGSVNVKDSSGDAALSIPLSGPKGKGSLSLKATKVAGQWVFSSLALDVEGSGKHIDLMGDVSTPALPVTPVAPPADAPAAPGAAVPAPAAPSQPAAEGAAVEPAPAKAGPEGGEK